MLGVAAPILALADVVDPVAALDQTVIHICGAGLAVVGIAMTLYAQVAMGNRSSAR